MPDGWVRTGAGGLGGGSRWVEDGGREMQMGGVQG